MSYSYYNMSYSYQHLIYFYHYLSYIYIKIWVIPTKLESFFLCYFYQVCIFLLKLNFLILTFFFLILSLLEYTIRRNNIKALIEKWRNLIEMRLVPDDIFRYFLSNRYNSLILDQKSIKFDGNNFKSTAICSDFNSLP